MDPPYMAPFRIPEAMLIFQYLSKTMGELQTFLASWFHPSDNGGTCYSWVVGERSNDLLIKECCLNENSNPEDGGCYMGFTSAIMPSWGNDMSVDMVADSLHHASYDLRNILILRAVGSSVFLKRRVCSNEWSQ